MLMVYPVKPSTFQLGLSGMRTAPLPPSNDSALPYFPAVVQVTPPRSAPVLLLPEASAVVVPEPSLKPRATTGAPADEAPIAASRTAGPAFGPKSSLGCEPGIVSAMPAIELIPLLVKL